MKFTITMKCPDALERAIEEAAEGEIGGPSDSEDHDEQYHQLVDHAQAVAAKWLRYGEIITITIDTDNETCVVEEA